MQLIVVCVQPEAGSQASALHAFPSSQFTGALTHPFAGLQLSFVHLLWSLQSIVVCVQPPRGSHPSVVQALLSLQLCGGCVQPTAGTQMSSVHRFVSSQFGGGPPTHDPFAHRSFVVHALPSLHGFVLGV